MNKLLKPTVKAEILSVLLSPVGSITCDVKIDCGEGEHYQNVTLRFDGDQARIAGYPQEWKCWDDPIEGNEDYTYGQAEDDGGIDDGSHEIDLIKVYISKKTEKKIFTQLKKCLEMQFEDEMFRGDLSKADQLIALEKIDLAIKDLS